MKAVHWSTFLTRNTTGTEVHGIIPSSVMTRSTKSGGVTSYTRFSRPREGTSCQFSKWVLPLRVTMRSSGSSGMEQWRLTTAGALVTNSKEHMETFCTEFVGHKGVGLHPLTELVGLATNQHRHIKGFGHQRDLRSPHSRHDVAVGQECVSAKEHLRHLEKKKIKRPHRRIFWQNDFNEH